MLQSSLLEFSTLSSFQSFMYQNVQLVQNITAVTFNIFLYLANYLTLIRKLNCFQNL